MHAQHIKQSNIPELFFLLLRQSLEVSQCLMNNAKIQLYNGQKGCCIVFIKLQDWLVFIQRNQDTKQSKKYVYAKILDYFTYYIM